MQLILLTVILSIHLINCQNFEIYTKWSEWSTTCERNCSDRFGFYTRTREKLECTGKNCKSLFNDDLEFVHKKLCYNGK